MKLKKRKGEKWGKSKDDGCRVTHPPLKDATWRYHVPFGRLWWDPLTFTLPGTCPIERRSSLHFALLNIWVFQLISYYLLIIIKIKIRKGRRTSLPFFLSFCLFLNHCLEVFIDIRAKTTLFDFCIKLNDIRE